ncbi:hypothetical protein E4T56_gene10770 [Termitomyces sp. T112]|nr:hypothetical protein E4T56_gene10770 [Termitomyces sp. T112]
MFFGLTNSPATFQTMMNDIFCDLIAEGVVCVYLDDILIYTRTLEEHHWVTCMVLEHLHQHQLYLKPEKYEFEQTKVEYLGLIILHGMAKMDPVKVAGVVEWPELRNKKEVQAFLRFVNFYQRFIQDFSHHAQPLFNLTVKNTAWQWEPLQQAAFDALKQSVTSKPVLLFPNNDSPFHVEADSSDFATGAVLSQQSKEDGKWHPVAFYSKSLNVFVAEFTQELYYLLGIKLHTTTAYHPQSNRQTGCVNQELEQYLHLFCNERQDNWDELLPDAEFQYNNYIHSSMQMTPFFLDTGRHPCMGFEPWACPSENNSVNEFVDQMRRAQEEAKAALVKAKEDMAWYYDCRWTPAPVYKPRDHVYLDSSDIKTTRPSLKLSHCHLGPFTVEKKVGPLAYQLKLPVGLHQLHSVFNVVKLFPAPEDPIPGCHPKPPPPPVLVNDEEEYEVEEILDSRVFQGKLQFKVKLKGYGIEDISWEPQANVHASGLVQDFYHRHLNAPKAIQGIYPISPVDQAICDFFYPVHQGATS